MTNHTRRVETHGLLGKAVAMMLLGAVVQLSWAALSSVHRHRMTARPAAEPRRLQRWEGEGGNAVTPRTTADPTPDAAV